MPKNAQIASVAKLVKTEPSIADPKPWTMKLLPAKRLASEKIQALINQIVSANPIPKSASVPMSERGFNSRVPAAPKPKVVNKKGIANVSIIGRRNALSRLMSIATTNSARKLLY